MSSYIISGIQQMGVGVHDLHSAWEWYRKAFGMNVPIFEEEAEAKLMLPYTGGKPRSRHAVLAINMQSGGGFEIWQYKGRKPVSAEKEAMIGDLGIYTCKIKIKAIDAAVEHFTAMGAELIGVPAADPEGRSTLFIRDPFGNIFQMVEAQDWFMKGKGVTGGAYGAIIGVTDTDRSMEVYSGILGYDSVVYDKTGIFDDLAGLPGGKGTFRRVLLERSKPFKGAFSRLFGDSVIELVEARDRKQSRIFEDRYWGDPGFIHLCYDISGMDNLKSHCEKAGYSFTVDSKASHDIEGFDMGEAAGHFSYIEDPDGTLIEFVETLKIPLLKKIGWYLDLTKRHPEKNLPGWMLRLLNLQKVKD
ncbi:MAG: VOC family protein [Bacteroidales bacterium]|nr:VOC family protein [Bacteroidales bacterium]